VGDQIHTTEQTELDVELEARSMDKKANRPRVQKKRGEKDAAKQLPPPVEQGIEP